MWAHDANRLAAPVSVIVKKLAAELGDAALDLLGLRGEIFLVVKANGSHRCTTPLRVIPYLGKFGKKKAERGRISSACRQLPRKD